jgi:hypothetical protein
MTQKRRSTGTVRSVDSDKHKHAGLYYADFEDLDTEDPQANSQMGPSDLAGMTCEDRIAMKGDVLRIARTMLETIEDHVSALNQRIYTLERRLARFSGPFDRFIDAELQNRLQLTQSQCGDTNAKVPHNPSGRAHELLRIYEKSGIRLP